MFFFYCMQNEVDLFAISSLCQKYLNSKYCEKIQILPVNCVHNNLWFWKLFEIWPLNLNYQFLYLSHYLITATPTKEKSSFIPSQYDYRILLKDKFSINKLLASWSIVRPLPSPCICRFSRLRKQINCFIYIIFNKILNIHI